jgi:glycine betaine catabolism B
MNIFSEQVVKNLDLITSKILSIENINSNYIIIKINRPTDFAFQAGQYVPFKLYDENGEFQYSYSIASSNKDEIFIEFCIQIIGNGRGVKFWRNLKIGDSLYFNKPGGNFKIIKLNTPIVLIAGGSGISPIRSFLRDLFDKNTTPSIYIHLIYGCKYASSIPFKQEFIELSKYFPSHFKIQFIAEEGESENVQKGDVLNALKNSHKIFNKESHYYLCGSPGMVAAVYKTLHEQNISLKNIFKDI